jgi:hypothetical protein
MKQTTANYPERSSDGFERDLDKTIAELGVA